MDSDKSLKLTIVYQLQLFRESDFTIDLLAADFTGQYRFISALKPPVFRHLASHVLKHTLQRQAPSAIHYNNMRDAMANNAELPCPIDRTLI